MYDITQNPHNFIKHLDFNCTYSNAIAHSIIAHQNCTSFARFIVSNKFVFELMWYEQQESKIHDSDKKLLLEKTESNYVFTSLSDLSSTILTDFEGLFPLFLSLI